MKRYFSVAFSSYLSHRHGDLDRWLWWWE